MWETLRNYDDGYRWFVCLGGVVGTVLGLYSLAFSWWIGLILITVAILALVLSKGGKEWATLSKPQQAMVAPGVVLGIISLAGIAISLVLAYFAIQMGWEFLKVLGRVLWEDTIRG